VGLSEVLKRTSLMMSENLITVALGNSVTCVSTSTIGEDFVFVLGLV